MMLQIASKPLSKQEIKTAFKGRTVYILDDETDSVEILEAYLSGYGLKIQASTNPASAIDSLKANRPDILLLDVMMPGMDGWHLYSQLRSEPNLAKLPVLFVTCLTDYDIEPEMEEASLCATLSKPVDRNQLIRKIVDLLQ